jgi:hypothetical protein
MESSLKIKISTSCPFFNDMESYCNYILDRVDGDETSFSVNTMVYDSVKKWMEKEFNVEVSASSEMNKIIPYKKRIKTVQKLLDDFEMISFDPFDTSIVMVLAMLVLMVMSVIFIMINSWYGVSFAVLFIILAFTEKGLLRKFSTPTFKDFSDKFSRDNYSEFNPEKGKFNRNEIRVNIIDTFSEIKKMQLTADSKFRLIIEND